MGTANCVTPKSKHIGIRLHYLNEQINSDKIAPIKVSSSEELEDVLTKSLALSKLKRNLWLMRKSPNTIWPGVSAYHYPKQYLSRVFPVGISLTRFFAILYRTASPRWLQIAWTHTLELALEMVRTHRIQYTVVRHSAHCLPKALFSRRVPWLSYDVCALVLLRHQYHSPRDPQYDPSVFYLDHCRELFLKELFCCGRIRSMKSAIYLECHRFQAHIFLKYAKKLRRNIDNEFLDYRDTGILI